jgi:hypothetical protein
MKRFRSASRVVIAVALALPLLLAAGSPAGARTCNGTSLTAPDGTIRLKGGQKVGVNHFPSAAISTQAHLGQSFVFKFKWTNNTAFEKMVRINSNAVLPANFVADLFQGQTPYSLFGTFQFVVGPGESTPALRLIVTKNPGNVGDFAAVLDGGYSNAPATACDALGAAVTA